MGDTGIGKGARATSADRQSVAAVSVRPVTSAQGNLGSVLL
jgi:hypothetical protein